MSAPALVARGQGPPVVLFHGPGRYREPRAAVGSGHAAVAPDLPGRAGEPTLDHERMH